MIQRPFRKIDDLPPHADLADDRKDPGDAVRVASKMQA
jgi:hypothetical protein